MLFEGLFPNRSIETPEPPEKASWPVIAPFTPEVILRDESSKIRPTPILKMTPSVPKKNSPLRF
jgi:hypothetical protein